MAKNALELAEVELHVLLRELERRLECATKPDKRLVLLGAQPQPSAWNHERGVFGNELRG